MDLTTLWLKIFVPRTYFLWNLFKIKLGYNARCHWLKERALLEYKTWSWAFTPSAKLYYVRPFPRLLSGFFIVSWKGNFVTSETASSNRRTEQRFVNIPSAVIYLIRTWAETKILTDLHRDNELLYPSFDSFHAQLDCKITNVLEKWGETLDFVLCVSLRSSLSLVYLPTILSCSSRSLRALQQNSTVVLGDQSFFSYLLGWVGERY